MSIEPLKKRSVLDMDRELCELRREVKKRRSEIISLNTKLKSACGEAKSLKAENEKLRKDLSDAQLTVSAMDMRIKDLMEERISWPEKGSKK